MPLYNIYETINIINYLQSIKEITLIMTFFKNTFFISMLAIVSTSSINNCLASGENLPDVISSCDAVYEFVTYDDMDDKVPSHNYGSTDPQTDYYDVCPKCCSIL